MNFTMAGLAPRGFYRLSDKVSLGLSAMIFSRNINWPEPSGKSVDAGTNVNASLLADINLRLFDHWDFYQGLGTMNAGSTLWKLGVAYRF